MPQRKRSLALLGVGDSIRKACAIDHAREAVLEYLLNVPSNEVDVLG